MQFGVDNQLPADLAFLDGEHLRSRLEQLATIAGFKQSTVSFR